MARHVRKAKSVGWFPNRLRRTEIGCGAWLETGRNRLVSFEWFSDWLGGLRGPGRIGDLRCLMGFGGRFRLQWWDSRLLFEPVSFDPGCVLEAF